MAAVLRGGSTAERLCSRLVAAALARGATRDATVVIARARTGSTSPPPRARLDGFDAADTQPAAPTDPPRESFTSLYDLGSLDGSRDE
jgi:hypothetical protein